MVGEEDIIRFLREAGGEATLEEISSALGIPKYGPNSAYAILYALKSKNIVERRGVRWALIEQGAELSETHKVGHPEDARPIIEGPAAESMGKPRGLGAESLKEAILVPQKCHRAYGMTTGFKTGTFLDKLFLGLDGEPLNGIPRSAQILVTGPLGAGKSLIASEIMLRAASYGCRVLYAILDDVWRCGSGTFDLETRIRFRAERLNINWDEISERIHVLNPPDINERFTEDYRRIIEERGMEAAIIDPINCLLDINDGWRGRRILGEIIGFNRAHRVTGIFTMHANARYGESIEHSYPAYLMDCITSMAPANLRVSGIDVDVSSIRGIGELRILRILSCRLCGFDGRGILISIGRDGLIHTIECEG